MQHAEHLHHEETNTGLSNRKMGFWLFLASECVFFACLIAGYLVYVGKSVTGPYPKDLFDIDLTSISTFVLLASSLFMVLAVNAAQRADIKGTRKWLLATAFFGLIFLGFQVYEFNHFYHMGLTLGGNLFGTTFYVLTGFHGTHVLVGVIWLLVQLVYTNRSYKLQGNKLTAEDALDVEIAGLYWHFVDVVWIVIFTVVYLVEFV